PRFPCRTLGWQIDDSCSQDQIDVIPEKQVPEFRSKPQNVRRLQKDLFLAIPPSGLSRSVVHKWAGARKSVEVWKSVTLGALIIRDELLPRDRPARMIRPAACSKINRIEWHTKAGPSVRRASENSLPGLGQYPDAMRL